MFHKELRYECVEKYENIFKGAYNKNAVYVKNKTRKNKCKNT